MEIHERISATIEDEKATASALANAIGVNRKQITRWTEGTAEMGIYKLKSFCEFYGVSADYILGLPRNLKWPR